MNTSTYTVVGMTCDHCLRSVTEEVSSIPGVTDINLDLDTGRLAVTSEGDGVPEAAVREAVTEAGYSLAG